MMATETDSTTISTGEELLLNFTRYGPHHPRSAECPGCGADCSREALVTLGYAFSRCECAREKYAHLIEQVWHRRCM